MDPQNTQYWVVVFQPIAEDVESLGSLPIDVKFSTLSTLLHHPFSLSSEPSIQYSLPATASSKTPASSTPYYSHHRFTTQSPDRLYTSMNRPSTGPVTINCATMIISWICRFPSPPNPLPALCTPKGGTSIYHRLIYVGASHYPPCEPMVEPPQGPPNAGSHHPHILSKNKDRLHTIQVEPP